MGYIKEPKGVDFIIKSNPLTDKDRSDISKLISDYKKKSKQIKENKTIKPSRKKVAAQDQYFIHLRNSIKSAKIWLDNCPPKSTDLLTKKCVIQQNPIGMTGL